MKIRVRVLVVVHVLVRVLPLELERLRVDRGVRGGVEDVVEERNGRPRAARVPPLRASVATQFLAVCAAKLARIVPMSAFMAQWLKKA